ncbi:DUF7380 domain-containing protein [Micromonospora trifolii]|uniref:DUF7380 domain-containing protein n=1 Tax=Micromonospora trifolii TaxID=2911208 RepID=UPI0027DFEDA6|nr:hypothetical protein [Micromonospora trifolii]
MPAVKDLPEPVIQLWRAVADSVTEPAANGRFHELLWCRRDRGAGLHAACAARAYLQLADSMRDLTKARTACLLDLLLHAPPDPGPRRGR